MRTPLRLGAFAAGLAVVFAGAAGLGRLTGPIPAPAAETAHAGDATAAGHGTTEGSTDGAHSNTTGGHSNTTGGHSDTTGGHSDPAGGHEAGAYRPPGGLQVAENGYRLVPLTGTLTDGADFRFRIEGPDGAPVTSYAVNHEKELHLIVVRRDLTAFQHIHPVRAADGTWSVTLRVPAAGQYRVFADFRPTGRAEGLTLGVDLPAPGDYRPQPLPVASRSVTVDGYTVSLAGALHAGHASNLVLNVTRQGVPLQDLEPYLGAYGHLVALRAGDLAYLHVHSAETAQAGPSIPFTAEVPSPGAYRLYLDFQHGGKVHTAEFTAIAEQ